MRLDSLELLKYGKFTDQHLSFPRARQDFHFVIGPNEAGKSTLRSAIVEALFGIATRSPLNFLHPLPELRLGACVSLPDQSLHFHRTKAASKTLRTPGNTVLPENALLPFLGNAEQHFFEQMFGLDHTRLIAGGKTILDEKDKVGQMLFQAAAGMADLGKARDQMKADAQKLWAPVKSKEREYYQAQQQLEAASAELKSITVRTKDWANLNENALKLQASLEQSRQQQAQLLQQQKRLQRVRRLAPHWHALQQAQQALQTLQSGGEVVQLDANAGEILQQAQQQLARSTPLLAHHQAEIERLEGLLAQPPLDSALLEHAEEIEALTAMQQRFGQHERDIALRQAEKSALWRQIQDACQQLNWPCDEQDSVEAEQAIRARLPHLPLRRQLDALAREESGLHKALLAADQAQASKQREIDSLQQALAQVAETVAAPHPALQAALQKAAGLGDIGQAQGKQQQASAKAQAALDQALLALGPWQKSVSELHAMLAPQAPALASWAQEQATLREQDKTSRQRLGDKAEEVAKYEAEIGRMQTRARLTTHQAVLASRVERDAQWHAIKSAATPLAQAAPGFENLMRQADLLADAHLANVEQANQLQTMQQQLQQAQQDQARLHLACRQGAEQLQAFAERWEQWCSVLGLPGLPLDQIHTWLTRREQALEAARVLAQEQSNQTQLQQSLSELQAQLRTCLPTLATASAQQGDEDVDTLCQRARQIIKTSEAAMARRAALQEQMQGAQAALENLQQQQQQAKAAQTRWQQAWDQACEAARMPQGSTCAMVAGALELCARIEENLQQRQQIQSQRIDTMRADLQNFRQSEEALAQKWMTGGPDVDVDADVDIDLNITQHLKQRLHHAQSAQEQATQWQTALATSREQWRAAQQTQALAQASLQPLLQRAGVQTNEALAEAIERAEQQRQCLARIAQCQSQLLADGDALNLEQIDHEIQAADIPNLVLEIDAIDASLAQIREQQDLLLKQETEAQLALAKVGGGDAAMVAEAKRQEALAQMADVAERYVKAFTAVHLLAWAINRYREEKQGPLLQRASELFAALSLNSFRRLLVNFDQVPLRLQGQRPDGKLVEISGMSDGTRDQLYLSLRLAALELHLQQATPLPFIADDLFINFDDARAQAGLQALARLSELTQVIFLSHHDHMLPMVRAVFGVGVNVVRL